MVSCRGNPKLSGPQLPLPATLAAQDAAYNADSVLQWGSP